MDIGEGLFVGSFFLIVCQGIRGKFGFLEVGMRK